MARPYDDPEPVDEDEWYDPTDWFDGNNIEWDDTYDANEIYRDAGYDGWHDTHYGDTYYGTRYGDGYGRYEDGYSYPYNDGYTNNDNYGWHYEWNPRTQSWDREHGWHDSYYETADNYGTHYVWNPDKDRWQQEYGRYDDYYSYQPRTSNRQAVRASWSDDVQGNRSRASSDERAGSQHRGARLDQDAGQAVFAGTVDSFNRKRIQGQHASHTLVAVDDACRVREQLPRGPARAQQEGVVGGAALGVRDVDLRRRFASQLLGLHVTDDADDGSRLLRKAEIHAELDLAADRVAITEVLARDASIDDGHGWRALAVAGLEAATGGQRHPHHAEVVIAYGPQRRVHALARRRRRLVEAVERAPERQPAERRAERTRHLLDAGDRFEP
jgi:hypothetical protein